MDKNDNVLDFEINKSIIKGKDKIGKEYIFKVEKMVDFIVDFTYELKEEASEEAIKASLKLIFNRLQHDYEKFKIEFETSD